MDKLNKIEDIYNRYIDDLYNYALYLGFKKEIVMDAIHDLFCKLAEDLDILNNIVNVKLYLFKSLKNRLLDILKSKQKIVEIKIDIEKEDELTFNFHINFDDEIVDEEDRKLIKRQVEEMLNFLTDRQREAIYLRYIQEYEYPQIAEILNISIHGCRKLVSSSIIRLREKYGLLSTLLL